MRKKRVYIESSVISYLTARPSSDIVKLAKQVQTRKWWERRHEWDLFISPTVIAEIQGGDQDAARKRLEAIKNLPILADTEEMDTLSETLIQDGILPEKASFDAFHIASATVCGMEYLITWNQKHLVNLDRLEILYSAIRGMGYIPPMLVRPDYMLEAYDGA